MTRLYNRIEEKEKRRDLRNNRPPVELMLWARLRGEQIAACRFRRQYSVGGYVLDFYCPAIKLAIELDGASHEGDDAVEYDANRQHYIESLGIMFLRFRNEQIYHALDGVVETIATTAQQLREKKTPPQPSPY